MVPRVLLGTAQVPGGGELRLLQRGAEFSIMLGANELMNSRLSGSEEALAEQACDRIGARPGVRMLIGGLGMGFTLRAALARLGPDAEVAVAEIVPAVVEWARGPMAAFHGDSLTDPRTRIVEGDVAAVIAEGEWGRIEEITLTYVVLSIWDERRLVLPSTYFTSTPFQNWTRSGSELLGAVEFDVDWRVSPSDLRDELDAILKATDLWDGRTANVQVTDATGGFVRVRVLVSAANSGDLWDLRCLVRERIVDWLQANSGDSLPHTRVLMVDESAPAKSRRRTGRSDGLFSGSPEAEQRGQQFTGAIELPTSDQRAGDPPAR